MLRKIAPHIPEVPRFDRKKKWSWKLEITDLQDYLKRFGASIFDPLHDQGRFGEGTGLRAVQCNESFASMEAIFM